jgi:hypothetical protein
MGIRKTDRTIARLTGLARFGYGHSLIPLMKGRRSFAKPGLRIIHRALIHLTAMRVMEASEV